MGDLADHAALERFLRSEAGKAHLEEIRQSLVGRRVEEVCFTNEMHLLTTTLLFDDGEAFVIFQPSLEVEALRESHGEILEREQRQDFPVRQPTKGATP